MTSEKVVEDLWENRRFMVEDPRFEGHTIDVDADEEIRCPYCGRLLMKGVLGKDTSIEMKCLRRACHKIIRIRKI